MLDHILFGSRHRSCLHNVRTRSGNITLTDHEMVLAEVRFKEVAQKPRSQPKVYTDKLRDEVAREAFCAEVKRYLDESDIVEGEEQSWANFRTALNAAATKLLIPEKRVQKPWTTFETLALIRKRAELQLRKHSYAEELLVFSNCCKEVLKALRSDKRQWLKDKGETIRDHSDKGDLKELFRESKQLCRKWSPHISKLVSTTGEPLKTKEERLERWTEHFKHLLNPATTSGNSVLSIVEASESLEIDLGPIRFDELLYAVRKLKNCKASGPDNISVEMLKSHIGIAEWLWDIVNKCWTEENLPQDWKLAEVAPLYKNKGKRSECGNYRGISLLSVHGKAFASIILTRCKDALDQVLREEQCTFRKSRGCTDQLFALRQILAKCMAFQLDVSFCFNDFRAAFDSVDREMMYKTMKHYGLPQKVLNVIRNSCEGFKCCVKAEGEKGQMFDVKTGVRQGDVWSPILFGLVINYVLANSVQGGINIGRCVADLDFADDVALLGISDSEVQANLHRIEYLAEALGLMINVGKTKNIGAKCKKLGASVPIAQKNVEVLTGNNKGRFGTLIEAENQYRLFIGREVLVGKMKNAG